MKLRGPLDLKSKMPKGFCTTTGLQSCDVILIEKRFCLVIDQTD